MASALVDTFDILESSGMIKDGMNVLDVGCSVGYWADTILAKGYKVNYIGLDVSLIRIHQNEHRFRETPYRFYHINALNKMYNPIGKIQQDKVKFPVANYWADLVICHSLFTHLGPFPNAAHYMGEIKRVSKPQSFLWITFFQYPPNEPNYETERTVYTAHQIESLCHESNVLHISGGKTTDYNDQLMLGLSR